MAKYSKQVSLGYDINGKRIRKRVYAETKQELLRREKELIRNADKQLQADVTLGQFAETWFQTYKTNKSAATAYYYSRALKNLEPLFPKRLKDITRSDVQRIINEKTPSVAHAAAMTIRQILDVAAADGLIVPKYLKLDIPKAQRKEKRALTAEEKEAVKRADLNPQERLFVDIELYLGLRPEETRALQPRDFDLSAETVTISKAVALDLATGEPILKSTKTGKTRMLPMPHVLAAEIRAYNADFHGFYYFVNEEGTLFTVAQYNTFQAHIFKKINRALGGNERLSLLNGWTMYSFRHNRATELYYIAGVSTKKKAEYMGHSEEMFLRTYSHIDESKEETELLRAVL